MLQECVFYLVLSNSLWNDWPNVTLFIGRIFQVLLLFLCLLIICLLFLCLLIITLALLTYLFQV